MATELKELGIECVDLVVDDHESVKSCYENVKNLLGESKCGSEDGEEGKGLDYLVNNAGKGKENASMCARKQILTKLCRPETVSFRPASELRPSEAASVIAANTLGPMLVTSAFLPLLLRSEGSTIINIGSLASRMPLPFSSVYCATKAALYQYSECLRVELAPLGINVTYVQAGLVQSRLFREKNTLDEHGLYAPVKQSFDENQAIVATHGMPAVDFARRLVGQILDEWHRNVVWIVDKGFMLQFTLVMALEWLLPFKIWPWILYRMHELDKVKKAYMNGFRDRLGLHGRSRDHVEECDTAEEDSKL